VYTTCVRTFYGAVLVALGFLAIPAYSDEDHDNAEIKWAPRLLIKSQPVQSIMFYEVELISNKKLTDVQLEVDKKLRPYVTVDPGQLKTVEKNTIYTVTLSVDLSSLSKPEKLDGKIFVKGACKDSGDDSIRADRPLLVHITGTAPITAFTNTTFNSGVGDPHWASFQPQGGTLIAVGGSRVSDGTPNVLKSIQSTGTDGTSGQVFVDAQGRPASADLTDGTHLTFQWLTATKALVVALVNGGQFQSNTIIDFSTITVPATGTVVSAAQQDKTGHQILSALLKPTPVRSMAAASTLQIPHDVQAIQATAGAASAIGTGTLEVDVTSSDTGAPVSNAYVHACLNGGVTVSDCPPMVETTPGIYQGPFQNSAAAIPEGLIEEKCTDLVDAIALSCDQGGDIFAEKMLIGGCEAIGISVGALNPPAGAAVGGACIAAFAAYGATCKWSASGGLSSAGALICPVLDKVVNVFDPGSVTLFASASKGNLSGSGSASGSGASALIVAPVKLAEPDCQVGSFTTSPIDPSGEGNDYTATAILNCVGNVPTRIGMQDIGTDGYTQAQSCSLTSECSMTIPNGAPGVVDTITLTSSSQATGPLSTIRLTFQ
jgi:hypothetical protein